MRHRGDIQGLRAIAVLLVALGHAGVAFLPGGFVGVDVFFVLSGFLITGILLAEVARTGSISLRAFYVRRARRILPAALLTLVVTQVAAFFLLNFLRAREAMWDSLSAAAFVANFRFAEQEADYFASAQPHSPLLHFWSLAVEEQFYLVWPALLALTVLGAAALGRRSGGVLLVVVLLVACTSLAWSIRLTSTLPVAAYFSPLTRAWELAVGAALAVGASTLVRVPPVWRLVLGWTGLLAIVAAATTFSSETPFPGHAALLPTIGTALVICAGMAGREPRRAVGRLLALAPLRALGDRSYAFYLWHWPVLILAGQYAGHELSVPVNLALLAGAFVLSTVSYALVENPLRRVRWSGARSALVFATSVAVVAVVSAVSLAAIERKEERFAVAAPSEPMFVPALPVAYHAARRTEVATGALPEVVAAVRAARRGERIPPRLTPPIGGLLNERPLYSLPRGCIPVARSYDWMSRICPMGRTGSSRSIVVIGDSHAQMWLPPILRMAERDGWVVLPILRPGCTPASWLDEYGLSLCRSWYRWATQQVRRLRPDVTIVGGAVGGFRGAEARASEHGMVAMAGALRGASRAVVLVGDPEGLRVSPVDCLLSRRASMRRCTTIWPPAFLGPYDRIAARSRRLGARFLDTRGWFCFERECPAVIGRTIVYKDPHHITAAYALRLSAVFRAAFRAEIRRG